MAAQDGGEAKFCRQSCSVCAFRLLDAALRADDNVQLDS